MLDQLILFYAACTSIFMANANGDFNLILLSNPGRVKNLVHISSLTKNEIDDIVFYNAPVSLPLIDKLNADQAKQFLRHSSQLNLNKINHIDLLTFKYLMEKQGDLELNSLINIEGDKLDFIKLHNGSLSLAGLYFVDNNLLSYILQNKGPIVLDGLSTIAGLKKNIFNNHKYAIYLQNLKKIDRESMESILSSSGDIFLGFTEVPEWFSDLSPKVAGKIYLPKIKELSEQKIKLLMACQPNIQFSGLETASLSWIEKVTEDMSDLNLSSLNKISRSIANALSAHRVGMLDLDGLTEIDIEVAEVLGQHSGSLSLSGLKTLSQEKAKYLSKAKGSLYLNGLTSLDDKSAQYLKSVIGVLELTSIEHCNVKTLEHLAAKAGYLDLSGLSRLNTDEAKALSGHQGTLVLSGLRDLSDQACAQLARHRGVLILDKLEKISKNGFSELFLKGDHKFDQFFLANLACSPQINYYLLHNRAMHGLSLKGLREITDDMALSLVNFDGAINLSGLRKLTVSQAKSVSSVKGVLCFDSIVSLDQNTAEPFRKKNGHLSLRALQYIPEEGLESLLFSDANLVLSSLRSISDRCGLLIGDRKLGTQLGSSVQLSPMIKSLLIEKGVLVEFPIAYK